VTLFDGTERTITLFNVLNAWEKTFLIKNCLTLLNSYSPSEVRLHCLGMSSTSDCLAVVSLWSTQCWVGCLYSAPMLINYSVVFYCLSKRKVTKSLV